MKKELIYQLFVIFLIAISYVIGIANKQVEFILITAVISTILFTINKVYSFLYLFILYINPFSLYTFNLPKEWPLVLIIFFTLINIKSVSHLVAKDILFRHLLIASSIFLVYQTFFGLLNSSNESLFEYVRNIGYLLAFFISIPAYYFIVKSRISIYYTISIVSTIIILIWLISYFSNFKILEISQSNRYGDRGMERITFYALNQITKFFIFLLPVIILLKISIFKKAIFFFLGLSSIFIIFLGLYRMEIFYTLSCLLLVILFVSKKYKLKKIIFQTAIVVILSIFILGFISSNIFDNLISLYSNTYDYIKYGGKETSADIRKYIELPQLIQLIIDNPIFGHGFFNLQSEKLKSWGYVDIPLLGNLAAYGFLGMAIYFLKFTFIVKGYRLFNNYWNNLELTTQIEFRKESLLIIVLFAYFISMITFRLFYITFEMTSAKLNAEFGFFVGVFFGLVKVVEKQRHST